MGAEYLEILAGPAAGTRIAAPDGLLDFGRSAFVEGKLGDDPELSRRHARLSRGPDGRLVLEDLGSSNGTFANEHRLTEPVTLNPGDMFRLGQSTLRLVSGEPAQPASPPVQETTGRDVPPVPAPGVQGTTEREVPSSPPPAAELGDAPAVPAGRSVPPRGQPSVIMAGLPGTMKGRIFPSVGLLVVQIIIGYEWLMSAFAKIFRGGFASGLGEELEEESKAASGWFRGFLDSVIIPNSKAFGYLIMVTELALGVILIGAALLWIFRWEDLRRPARNAVLLGTAAACIVGISMNVGFYLSTSSEVPFWIATDPFEEGVGLDVLLPMFELVVAAVALWTYRSIRRAGGHYGARSGGRARHVVVAGGGFGGLAAAQSLERSLPDNVRITVVSDANFKLYTPLLPGAAGGALEPTSVAIPLRDRLRRSDLKLARVVGGDPETHSLEIEPLELPKRPGGAGRPRGGRERLFYDELIVALGSVSRTFDIPGLSDHAIGLKTLPEAVALRNWLVRTLENAEALDDEEERTPYLTYVFAGAGYAGVEGIAELQAFADKAIARYPRCRMHGMRWVLLQAAPRIMPEIDERLAEFAAFKLAKRGIEIYTDTALAEVRADSVRLDGGDVIPTRTVVWTAGVEAHPVVQRLGLPLTDQGRIRATPYMQVEGVEGVWAIGDAAAVPDPDQGGQGWSPPTAQHANQQGKAVARNVAAVLGAGTYEPYSHRSKGAIVDLGRRSAVGITFGIRWRGFAAWLLARAHHASEMPGIRRKVRLMADWSLDAVQGRDLSDLGQLEHPRAQLGKLDDHSSGGTSVIRARPAPLH